MVKRQSDMLIDKLADYTGPSALGRIRVDMSDLVEICDWYINFVNRTRDGEFSDDELETVLIELETKFIDHANFHLKSLKRDIRRVLRKIPED